MAFAGPKGGITLSLVLTVPATLPASGAFPIHDALALDIVGRDTVHAAASELRRSGAVPHKAESRRTKKQADAEARIVMRVIESIASDAPTTGSVTGSDSHRMSASNDVDEPATAIVMKRYADQLQDLAAQASKDVGAQARAVVAKCDEAYDRIEEVDKALREAGLYSNDADEDDSSSLTAHFRALRDTYDAVEDIQAQALARELEYVKEAAAAGDIDARHAKELRNDVYIQQLTL